jgi:peptidyl-prolyl cis-trans isomerase D
MGSGISKTAMWFLMALLFVGLAGFGATNLGGTINSLGTVGDKNIPVQQYARQLQNEIRAIEAQTGQPLPFSRVQEGGLDRLVLQRLVRTRALDHENAILGLSIGDETLGQEIMQIPAFQGVNGAFDREGYRFALQQGGVTEAEFELSLREEVARTILQGSIAGGTRMPAAYAETLVNYAGEQRSFTWALLDESNLTAPPTPPNDDILQEYYQANSDAFMLPEAKLITYIWLKPEDLMDEITVPEEELRAAYDERADQYNQPERRLIERLVFADDEAARRAMATLEVSGTTFNALVADRGLDLADVDMGDVSLSELGAAGEAVFAAESGAVVGPQPSDLGPALFRINGILPAQNTSFEDAAPALRDELGLARAIRAVEARALDIDDQLAGGATLAQLAEETGITLGNIIWTAGTTESIAAYANFRAAAATLTAQDFPQVNQLEDGGIFAMALDEELPVRPNPFDDARAEVEEAWRAEQIVSALTAQATTIVETIGAETAFADAGLEPNVEVNQTRTAFIPETPQGFITDVFEMAVGDVSIMTGTDTVIITRLDAIADAAQDADNQRFLEQLRLELDQALANDLFEIYSDDVVRRAEPQIDQRALQAVHVNFP